MSASPPAGWFRLRDDGIDIRVRLTPKGGRDGIDGILALADGTQVLAARVRAAPEKGQANKALEKLVANALGVARATVAVASGHKARLKTVHVAGDADQLARAAAALGATTGEGEGK